MKQTITAVSSVFTCFRKYLCLFASLTAPMAAIASPNVLVETTQLRFQEASRPVHTSGHLAYKSIRKLSFKTAGSVTSLRADTNNRVEKDQLLASLDTEETQARLTESEARSLEALRNLERLEQLYQKKAISQDRLQAAQTRLNVTQAQQRIARFNNRYSHIRAPTRGLIIERLVETGELVSPQQTVFILADESAGWVMRAGLSDRNLVRVKTGDPAKIFFDAWPDTPFVGTLTEITPTASPLTGTFEIEITLEDPPLKIYQGFIGRITITPKQTQYVARLPAGSLLKVDKNQGVIFVIDATTRRIREEHVNILGIDDQAVSINTALPENSIVITRGAVFLKPGDWVPQSAVTNR